MTTLIINVYEGKSISEQKVCLHRRYCIGLDAEYLGVEFAASFRFHTFYMFWKGMKTKWP